MARNWHEWHRAYDDPTSSLSQRLRVVTAMIRSHLDSAPPGPIRVLSLCAGDGRDLADAAPGHTRAPDLSGCLVELDPLLADRARANLGSAGSVDLGDGGRVSRTGRPAIGWRRAGQQPSGHDCFHSRPVARRADAAQGGDDCIDDGQPVGRGRVDRISGNRKGSGKRFGLGGALNVKPSTMELARSFGEFEGCWLN